MTRSPFHTPWRRWAQTAAVLAVALLLAASCTGGDADDGTGNGFDGTIRLGAALSETGVFASPGADARQGYDTWARWVNEEYGGIRIGESRYRVEIIYRDDESDPGKAAARIRELIDDDEVDYLLGPYSSTLTETASAEAEASDVILMAGNGAADSIYGRGFRSLFTPATIASDYTRSSIELLASQGARTAVVAHEDTAFATSVADGALRHLEANGIEVLTAMSYPRGVDNVDGLMRELAALEPDVFVGGGHYDDAVLFVRSARGLGFGPDAMLLTVGPSNPQLIDDLGAYVDGVLGPTQWEPAMSYEGAYFGTAADYASYYESLWGAPPVYQAASATAAALALHLAIELAGSRDADEVRTALGTLDADTFYGPIRFDERGVNVAKPMGTVQVQDGHIVVVAPAAAAEGDLVYPAR
ncbi:amino acid ABC transporter substrate-binding protein [Candidatus Poriferisodalis sp.]|uniref:amino acid ABC transporter substrate-binding protein n=1 Tax=Candidatus Poriferisodalis sp. TaxID=3101277 RepID=UPI003B028B93